MQFTMNIAKINFTMTYLIEVTQSWFKIRLDQDKQEIYQDIRNAKIRLYLIFFSFLFLELRLGISRMSLVTVTPSYNHMP